jgi:hypothetical protein
VLGRGGLGLACEHELGPDFAVGALGKMRRKGAIFAEDADPPHPTRGEVAKNKLSGGRQHRCGVVRGCPSWFGFTAIMDDHRVWRSGHKTEEGHRLAAMGTGRSPGNRQRSGGYQQQVNVRLLSRNRVVTAVAGIGFGLAGTRKPLTTASALWYDDVRPAGRRLSRGPSAADEPGSRTKGRDRRGAKPLSSGWSICRR